MAEEIRKEVQKEMVIISFTEEGQKLSQKIIYILQKEGISCTGYYKISRKTPSAFPESPVSSNQSFLPDNVSLPALIPLSTSLTQWTGEQFLQAKALIFVGAAGIAVRVSAPWIRDKFQDPAVLVVDEMGKFVIPILSGHMGGANALAYRLAEGIHAVPVITTATDIRGCFAVDVFARENGLYLTDRKLAKMMSAQVLEGSPIGVFSDIPVRQEEMPGCRLGQAEKLNLYVGIWKREKWEKETWAELLSEKNTLQLVPKCLVLGLGCRKDIASEELKKQVMEGLCEWNIWPQAVKKLATINLKKEEKAIRLLCREMNWEQCLFSSRELAEAEGKFSYSAFVEKTTGVGNVCERAAALGAGSPLLFGKKIKKGVTMAAAILSGQMEKSRCK